MPPDSEAEILRRKVMAQLNQLIAIETAKAFRKLRDRKQDEAIKQILDEHGGITSILTPEEREIARKMREQGARKQRGLPWRHFGNRIIGR